MKGFAWSYAIFSGLVCLHALLKDDLYGLRWFLIGATLSSIIALRYFVPGNSTVLAERLGMAASETATSYKLATVGVASSFAVLAICLFYLRIPLLCVLISGTFAIFNLLEGWRSGLLVGAASTLLLLFAMGRSDRMRSMGRGQLTTAVLVLLAIGLSVLLYEHAVRKGWMGEAELAKYEMQKETRIGLASGRSQFVVAALALRDSPVIGHGSWTSDDKTQYNIRAAELVGNEKAKVAYDRDDWYVHLHSHLWQAWVWHGIFGGVFWIYVLALMAGTLRFRMGVVPELYAYLAITIPFMTWNVLFSPPGGRVNTAVAIVVMILVRHYGKRHAAMVFSDFAVPADGTGDAPQMTGTSAAAAGADSATAPDYPPPPALPPVRRIRPRGSGRWAPW
jgi:hypothetical protein